MLFGSPEICMKAGKAGGNQMAKTIMIQGTMSNSGKSFLVAALCRIFRQDGYRVAPFKSQNMALNSYITRDGLEIGRAQAMQAEAAGIEPAVDMNPILLKPTSHMGSQVIVRGEVAGNWKAMDYYRRKQQFIPLIRESFGRLADQYDVIVLEGAGSPAEINLRDHDIVNMGMARMARAPVLLVGDIDRGGVFASLYGTVSLLEPEERAMIRGLVINKFRGDVEILRPGLGMIEERLGIPVTGVIPMGEVDLDDEDSLSRRLEPGRSREMRDGLWQGRGQEPGQSWKTGQGQSREQESDQGQSLGLAGLREGLLDVAVIHFPHISNFTDFNVVERKEGIFLRYVKHAGELGSPDLVILPGTKNTMEDLRWLRETGLEPRILRLVREEQVPVIGICGGYQMLGQELMDPEGVEGPAGSRISGMGLLPVRTVFAGQKTRTRIQGELLPGSRMFPDCGGRTLEGYEIHMGITEPVGAGGGTRREISAAYPSGSSREAPDIYEGRTSGPGRCRTAPVIRLSDGRADGFESADGLAFGSYLHGLFDNEWLTDRLLERLAGEKGIRPGGHLESVKEYKERQYDKLAALVRSSLDMKAVYRILEQGLGR